MPTARCRSSSVQLSWDGTAFRGAFVALPCPSMILDCRVTTFYGPRWPFHDLPRCWGPVPLAWRRVGTSAWRSLPTAMCTRGVGACAADPPTPAALPSRGSRPPLRTTRCVTARCQLRSQPVELRSQPESATASGAAARLTNRNPDPDPDNASGTAQGSWREGSPLAYRMIGGGIESKRIVQVVVGHTHLLLLSSTHTLTLTLTAGGGRVHSPAPPLLRRRALLLRERRRR